MVGTGMPEGQGGGVAGGAGVAGTGGASGVAAGGGSAGDGPGPFMVRVSVSFAGGETIGNGFHPDISASGRFVAFSSIATSPDPAVSSGGVFLHDRETKTTDPASSDSRSFIASSISVSDDGRFVAFASYATNLVPDDDNEASDVFVADRLALP